LGGEGDFVTFDALNVVERVLFAKWLVKVEKLGADSTLRSNCVVELTGGR
jgi:hypothetical protein